MLRSNVATTDNVATGRARIRQPNCSDRSVADDHANCCWRGCSSLLAVQRLCLVLASGLGYTHTHTVAIEGEGREREARSKLKKPSREMRERDAKSAQQQSQSAGQLNLLLRTEPSQSEPEQPAIGISVAHSAAAETKGRWPFKLFLVAEFWIEFLVG